MPLNIRSRRSGEGNTIPERIHRYLTARTPEPICDDCVAQGSDVNRETVNPITQTLGLTTDFAKVRGTCSLCKNEKLVTRSLRYA
jgi:hypothetical protein